MRTSKSLSGDLLDKLKEDLREAADDRESSQAQGRQRLREFVAHLRDAGDPYDYSPASKSSPSFKVGAAAGFNHVSERGESHPERGHLSESAYKDFMANMKDAAGKQNVASRDAAVGRAARNIAQDWANKHGLGHGQKGVVASMLHEARAQVTFRAVELGQKLGVGPVTSAALGYSLERALEKEGFRVLANHTLDKLESGYKASIAAVAGKSGMMASMERNLSTSMTWMAERGVTSGMLKEALSKHMGKFSVISEVAQHPEAIQRAAQLISHSDSAFKAVASLANDAELRKAVGTMTLAAGESIAYVNKGVGSVAILAGSAMRGDSGEEMGRHAFRAALSVLGGAAGGIAAGSVSAGFGSAFGAMAGASAGSALADKVLSVYDDFFNRGAQANNQHTVSKGELADSAKVLENRAESSVKTHVREMVREMSPGRA